MCLLFAYVILIKFFFFFVLDTHDPDKNEIPLTIDRLTGKRNLLLIIPGSKSKLFF